MADTKLLRVTLVVASTVVAATAGRAAQAAGIEHPDLGTVALGRGGAYAADPVDGLALQYNPAGFAQQTGLRLTADASLSWQALSFAPADGTAAASNNGGAFLEPAGAISYGLGAVGPLSGLTFALGAVGPSAVGKENYAPGGPQRYALISTDYFIAYYSAAVAASFRRWLSGGVTVQLVKGTAKFTQAVWSGSSQGTDPAFDALAHVDVTSKVIPTAVIGVTVRPVPRLAIGASYRPHFTFDATGSLTTDLPPSAIAIRAHQVGTDTAFVLKLPDVVRLGAQFAVNPRLLVEANVVYERWSILKTIEIHPQGITVVSDNFGVSKPLGNIIFPKNYEDAFSIRLGGEYALMPGRLAVRAGYLHETSAIPNQSTSVDFGNWARDMVAIGGSVSIPRTPVTVDVAYAHHFLGSRTVTDSNVTQVVTPCLTPGCTDPAPTVVGNGTYDASLDVVSVSLRVALDARREAP
jgi:long-subunit fatty acid transport protein